MVSVIHRAWDCSSARNTTLAAFNSKAAFNNAEVLFVAPLSMGSIGFPIKLLHEAEGHIVTVELRNGEMYRGRLVEAEDNMSCQLSGIVLTGKDGKVASLEQVYLRGSHVRFMILPDMLKHAPMFNRIDPKQGVLRGKGVGVDRGRGGRGRGGMRGR